MCRNCRTGFHESLSCISTGAAGFSFLGFSLGLHVHMRMPQWACHTWQGGYHVAHNESAHVSSALGVGQVVQRQQALEMGGMPRPQACASVTVQLHLS